MHPKSDRRTFLFLAGAAALTGPAATLAEAQTPGKLLIPHPSWDCSMPGGLPKPEDGKLLFELRMKLDLLAKLGKTPFGSRRAAVGLEGTISGPNLTGTVTAGSLDYELTLSNGVVEVEQIFVFKLGDGKYVYSEAPVLAPTQRTSGSQWISKPPTAARQNG